MAYQIMHDGVLNRTDSFQPNVYVLEESMTTLISLLARVFLFELSIYCFSAIPIFGKFVVS